MKKIHCMFVIGTRPEVIKMAPIVCLLKKNHHEFKITTVLTGQHYEIVNQMTKTFDLEIDIDLKLMQQNQSPTSFTAKAITSLSRIFRSTYPDIVMVQGDTSTTFSASWTAFQLGIPVAHVEAGLRSNNIRDPFPEEANRRLTGVLADLHFAPTNQARDNLLNENIQQDRIFITGNTVIDALKMIKDQAIESALSKLKFLNSGKKILLVTAHRRENHGKRLEEICSSLLKLVNDYPDIQIVWPVHPNPAVAKTVNKRLHLQDRIYLTPPLDYITFIGVLGLSTIVLTDSGGLQEEAPAFAKPVLVLRNTTERPEGIIGGTAKLVGTSEESIKNETSIILDDSAAYRRMAEAISPYGDGKAAYRIIELIKFFFGINKSPPGNFEYNKK